MKRKHRRDVMDVIQGIAKRELPLPRGRRSRLPAFDDVIAWGELAARALEAVFEAERVAEQRKGRRRPSVETRIPASKREVPR